MSSTPVATSHVRFHRLAGALATVAIAVLAFASRAHAWEPFRSPNDEVERGNARLKKGNPERALQAYDEAARKLPSEPGVHLNRGLALVEQGKLGKARETLLHATEPPASDQVRAAAYYNMGLAFYRQGEKAAKNEKHDKAQGLFREAADALRRSLRTKPGNADAAWNLELARRRIREQKKKQKKKQAKNEQNKDQQNQGQNDQDQQNQQNQQGQNDQREDNQDQKKRAQQNQGSKDQKKQSGQQNSQDRKQQKSDRQRRAGNQQNQDRKSAQRNEQRQQRKRAKSRRSQQDRQARTARRQRGQQLPEHMSRVLDNLKQTEDNFHRHRARQRSRHRRQPEKDW